MLKYQLQQQLPNAEKLALHSAALYIEETTTDNLTYNNALIRGQSERT